MIKTVRLLVDGRVQGIGFRYFVKRKADKLGLSGWVRNLADARVEAVIRGEEERVAELIKKIKQGPPLAEVKDLTVEDWQGEAGGQGFEIRRE